MSTIKDGAFKFWKNRQPDILPLDSMRAMEAVMVESRPQRILEVGLDLTVLAVLAYAKENKAKVDLVLPENMALLKDLRRISGQLGLDVSNMTTTQAVGAWPLNGLPAEVGTYDCVRLMGYGRAEPRHRKAVLDQVAPILSNGAMVFVYPCNGGDESQLINDFSDHIQAFDIQRTGSMVCLRTGAIESTPLQPDSAEASLPPLVESASSQDVDAIDDNTEETANTSDSDVYAGGSTDTSVDADEVPAKNEPEPTVVDINEDASATASTSEPDKDEHKPFYSD